MLMSRSDHLSGFTLVELMVTIAILAIIAMMAVPSFNKMIAKQHLNTSVRELIMTFNQARSQAALLHREVSVSLNNNTPNSSVNYYWKPYSDYHSNDSTSIKNSHPQLTTSTTNITFTASGLVKDATTDTDFEICHKKIGVKKIISITRTGNVSNKADGTCS